MLDWIEHPEARREYLEALTRYGAIEDGLLGEEFADEADAAIELILTWPNSAPLYRGMSSEAVVRSWRLGKFPYSLIYVVQNEQILVLAYAPSARRPGYWARRLTPS